MKKTVTIRTSHLLIAVLLIIAIGVGGYFVYTNMNKPEDSNISAAGGMVFDPNAKDYTGDDPKTNPGKRQVSKFPATERSRYPRTRPTFLWSY